MECNDEIINEESNKTDNYCVNDNSGALDSNSTIKTDSSKTKSNIKTEMGNNMGCQKPDEQKSERAENPKVRSNFRKGASPEKNASCTEQKPKCTEKPKLRCSFSFRASSEQKPKCTDKPKPSYRNPFFNYLRDFRKSCPNLTAIDVAVRGAKKWNRLSPEEKEPYILEARNAPKMVYRRRKKECNVSSKSAIDNSSPERKRNKRKLNKRKSRKPKLKNRSKQRKKRKNVKCKH